MTCSHCDSWMATSRAQLKTRARNLSIGGEIYACPKCGTRDWAMSEAKIKDEWPDKHQRSKLISGIGFALFILICATVSVFLTR